MKKVDGHNSLYRNESGAIVNIDDAGFHAYKKRRAKLQSKDAQINTLGKELIETKKELEEIKELLKEVLKKQVQ